jgi:hypothetical protein
MNLTDKIKKWGDLHHPKILDVIRVSLGVFLFAKGFLFFNDAD